MIYSVVVIMVSMCHNITTAHYTLHDYTYVYNTLTMFGCSKNGCGGHGSVGYSAICYNNNVVVLSLIHIILLVRVAVEVGMEISTVVAAAVAGVGYVE